MYGVKGYGDMYGWPWRCGLADITWRYLLAVNSLAPMYGLASMA
jgi:hypothetical protein